jgi:3-oxoacyl-[acyl-carrier protein] reductase
MDSNGRWVLVTGGTRGIGRGIATCLSRAGYKTVVTYLKSGNDASKLLQEAASASLDIAAYQCDGADGDSVKKLVAKLVELHGAPLALVNNAGITSDELLFRMHEDSWDKVVRTNLKSVFLYSQAVLPSMMTERNGVILNMSSVAAIKGNIGQCNYAATKAGMLGMSRALALEVARFNIRVNSILPGLVDTEMIANMPEQELREMRKRIPLKRLCGVEEVSSMVQFLISPLSSYITGQAFCIDGGLTV